MFFLAWPLLQLGLCKTCYQGIEGVSHIILKMVGYVMKFAPLGVFGAIAAVIATKGLEIFVFMDNYLLFFVIGILFCGLY